MNRAFMVATVMMLIALATSAPSAAAPVSSKSQQSPKPVSQQQTTPTAQTTNRFLTPRMMDRKRPMNPVCDQGFKPGAPSSCHY